MQQGKIVYNTYYARFIYRGTITNGNIWKQSWRGAGRWALGGARGAIMEAGPGGAWLQGCTVPDPGMGEGSGKRGRVSTEKYRYICQPFKTCFMDLVIYDLLL